MTQREEFEAAYTKHYPIASGVAGKFEKDYGDGDYTDTPVSVGWTLWQAAQTAMLAKLAAGVSVEPVGTVVDPTYVSMPEQLPYGTPLYTAAAIAAARVQAIEECAKLCEDYAADKWSLYKGRKPYNGTEQGRADPDTQGHSDGANACADAIRALLGKEAQS